MHRGTPRFCHGAGSVRDGFGATLSPMSNAETSSHRDVPERRHNPRLRELVDEMLASIRAAASVQLWTAEERDRYEADMARIMKTVQTHAVVRDTRAQLD